MLGTRRRLLPSSAAGPGAGGSTTAYGAVSVKTRPSASAKRAANSPEEPVGNAVRTVRRAAASEIRRAHEGDALERRIDHHVARVLVQRGLAVVQVRVDLVSVRSRPTR